VSDGPTLLTGATGFVGSAVARVLAARGHRLRLLVRATSDRRNLAGIEAELALGDLTDDGSLARAAAGCRYVVHVAADYRFWVPDPDAMLRANVDGSVAVMRAAQAAGVERIVHCSSIAALGTNADGTPADETTPVNEADFIGTYKRSKFLAERAVMDLVRHEGLQAVVVNPAGPVGPRDIKPTPTGKMIRDAAAGRVPAYIDTGLNLVHVDDVAEGHALALERGRIGERYILGGENVHLGTMLADIAHVVGRRPPRLRLPIALVYPFALGAELRARWSGREPFATRDGLRMARQHMFFSDAKARRDLGYVSRPYREGIADAISWFRQAGYLQ
jgi:dihydroflavonol-4-reductase